MNILHATWWQNTYIGCSVAELCLTPCDRMNCSMPDFPVLHYLLEFAQMIPYNHLILFHLLLLLPLISPRIGVFFNELALPIRWPKYWSSTSAWVPPINIQVDFIQNWLAWSCCPRDSQESSPAPQLESINSSALSIPYSPTLTSLHDYWKNHSFNYMDLCQQNDVSAFKYMV